jgi:hypothetical protein
MNPDEQRFAQALRESTPEPPFDISLEAVQRQRNRRQYGKTALAVATVVALAAAGAGVPALVGDGTHIRVAEATDGLSVTYHGVTFDAPDGWQLGEGSPCGAPENQSVIVGPAWQTSHCAVPWPNQEPTWVWLTQIANADVLNPQSSYAGKPTPQRLEIDGQPAYLQQETRGERGYTLTLPWLGVRAEIKSPDANKARELVSRISASATGDSLAVPEDANTAVLQKYTERDMRGPSQVTVNGPDAAAIIRELRGLEIRQGPDTRCTGALGKGTVVLTTYGPSRQHRSYVVRGGDCAETYGGTGVAGATTRTLRALINQQLS